MSNVPWNIPEAETDEGFVDWWQLWLESHGTEVAKHGGHMVALHRHRGIIASAPTIEEIFDILRTAGISTVSDEVIVMGIPHAGETWLG